MKKLLIIGAGGFGKLVADAADANGIENIIFLDDCYPNIRRVANYPVVGTVNDASNFCEHLTEAIVAIGDNHLRVKLLKQLKSIGFNLAIVVHPSAYVSKSAEIGPGSVLNAQVNLNTYSRIGLGVIVSPATTISHDCTIGDGVKISPGSTIAGTVTIGNYSWVGAGSTIINNIVIGQDVIVGAGTVIIKNVEDKVTIVGVPGKVIKRHE